LLNASSASGDAILDETQSNSFAEVGRIDGVSVGSVSVLGGGATLVGGPNASLGAEITVGPPAPDMSVGRQDQAMLLIASGIVTPLMPPWLQNAVRNASNGTGTGVSSNASSNNGVFSNNVINNGNTNNFSGGRANNNNANSVSSITFSALEDAFRSLSSQGMPAPLARAAASAAVNPLMRHIISTASQLDTSNRPVDITRLVSVVGKVACNAAIAVAAVSTGLFVLPAHTATTSIPQTALSLPPSGPTMFSSNNQTLSNIQSMNSMTMFNM
jgi:hypothetical protein